MATSSFDVVVIGGGVLGLATVYQLNKQQPGITIAMVEQSSEEGLEGTSTGTPVRELRSLWGASAASNVNSAYAALEAMEREWQAVEGNANRRIFMPGDFVDLSEKPGGLKGEPLANATAVNERLQFGGVPANVNGGQYMPAGGYTDPRDNAVYRGSSVVCLRELMKAFKNLPHPKSVTTMYSTAVTNAVVEKEGDEHKYTINTITGNNTQTITARHLYVLAGYGTDSIIDFLNNSSSLPKLPLSNIKKGGVAICIFRYKDDRPMPEPPVTWADIRAMEDNDTREHRMFGVPTFDPENPDVQVFTHLKIGSYVTTVDDKHRAEEAWEDVIDYVKKSFPFVDPEPLRFEGNVPFAGGRHKGLILNGQPHARRPTGTGRADDGLQDCGSCAYQLVFGYSNTFASICGGAAARVAPLIGDIFANLYASERSDDKDTSKQTMTNLIKGKIDRWTVLNQELPAAQ